MFHSYSNCVFRQFIWASNIFKKAKETYDQVIK